MGPYEIKPVELMPVSELEVMERAQIDSLVATAKRYPRDLEKVENDLVAYIEKYPDQAKQFFYTVPRGKGTIEGESVRLAELIASKWGNLTHATRVLEADATTISAQAVVVDLETNTRGMATEKRSIINKDNQRYPEHLILTTGKAAASIAFRDAVFKVIPKVFLQTIIDKAKEVAVSGNVPERIEKAFQSFAKAGVPEDKLLSRLGKKSKADLDKDDLGKLIGFFNAMKDGALKVADFVGEDTKPTAKAKKEVPVTVVAEIPEEDI